MTSPPSVELNYSHLFTHFSWSIHFIISFFISILGLTQIPIFAMKKLLVLILLLFFLIPIIVSAQEEEEEKEVKTGFGFGGTPALAYDSDLGFLYGIILNFYHYGDGSRYPRYDHSLYMEWSRTTKGTGKNILIYPDTFNNG